MSDESDLKILQAGIRRHACLRTMQLQADRVAHFATRIGALGKTPDDVVITLLNVNDPHGAALTNVLMPGHPWDEIRARGEVPFARGLAAREGLQELLDGLDKEFPELRCGADLRALSGKIAVLVMDHGGIEVFEAPAPVMS